jgi:hypothetical protein
MKSKVLVHTKVLKSNQPEKIPTLIVKILGLLRVIKAVTAVQQLNNKYLKYCFREQKLVLYYYAMT